MYIIAMECSNIEYKFKVIHLIGLNQIDPIKKIYEESNIEAEVLSYVHNIEVKVLSKIITTKSNKLNQPEG